MGDGTKQNPYTREDVLRLIEENGGTAQGLDLSGKVFEEGIDLSKLDLSGIILKRAVFKLPKSANFEEANLLGADFEEATLINAHFEKANLMYGNLAKAKLPGAHFEDAILSFTDFENANLGASNLERADLSEPNLAGTFLFSANLTGAYLAHPRLSSNTGLHHVEWGDFILGEERSGQFRWAKDTYRQLKTWYAEHGMYDTAGEFFFREMTARRKELELWPNPFSWIWSKFISLICGYGERPLRVVASASVVILGLALIYFAIGTLKPNSFLNSLYYSAVSFTALGYGKWAAEPTGWVKWLGVAEAFIGVFMMALFLVTFTRKMTR